MLVCLVLCLWMLVGCDGSLLCCAVYAAALCGVACVRCVLLCGVVICCGVVVFVHCYVMCCCVIVVCRVVCVWRYACL